MLQNDDDGAWCMVCNAYMYGTEWWWWCSGAWYVWDGMTQGEDIASVDIQPRFCATRLCNNWQKPSGTLQKHEFSFCCRVIMIPDSNSNNRIHWEPFSRARGFSAGMWLLHWEIKIMNVYSYSHHCCSSCRYCWHCWSLLVEVWAKECWLRNQKSWLLLYGPSIFTAPQYLWPSIFMAPNKGLWNVSTAWHGDDWTLFNFWNPSIYFVTVVKLFGRGNWKENQLKSVCWVKARREDQICRSELEPESILIGEIEKRTKTMLKPLTILLLTDGLWSNMRNL